MAWLCRVKWSICAQTKMPTSLSCLLPCCLVLPNREVTLGFDGEHDLHAEPATCHNVGSSRDPGVHFVSDAQETEGQP